MALVPAEGTVAVVDEETAKRWEVWRSKVAELQPLRDRIVDEEKDAFELLRRAQEHVIAVVRAGDDDLREAAEAACAELESRYKDVAARRMKVQRQLEVAQRVRDADPDPALSVGDELTLAKQRRQPFSSKTVSLESRPLSRCVLPDVPPQADENIVALPVTDAALQRLFTSFDTNGNGFLEWDEFRRIYATFDNCGVTYSEAAIEDRMRKYNVLGDGKMSFQEFSMIVLAVHQR